MRKKRGSSVACALGRDEDEAADAHLVDTLLTKVAVNAKGRVSAGGGRQRGAKCLAYSAV